MTCTLDSVRALIPDNTEPYIFADSELQIYLDLNEDDVYLAVAQALEVLASQIIMSGGTTRISTDDLTIEDKVGYQGFLDRANQLRQLAANDAFVLVYPFSNSEGSDTDLRYVLPTW